MQIYKLAEQSLIQTISYTFNITLDKTGNSSVAEKKNLIVLFKMLFIEKRNPSLNIRTDSIRAKLLFKEY